MKQQLLFAAKLLAFAGGYLFTKTRTSTKKYRIRSRSVTDIAVLLLLENLKRLILNRTRLIHDSKNQIEMLENDVRLFKSFLIDSSKRRIENERMGELVREIRALVNEAEDAIDAYEVQAEENRSRSFFVNAFGGQGKMVRVAKEVERVRAKVKGVYGNGGRITFATMRVGGECGVMERKGDVKIFGSSPHLEIPELQKDAFFFENDWVPTERNFVD